MRQGARGALHALRNGARQRRGVPKDKKKAAGIFKRACDSGAGAGCYVLATLHVSGEGGVKQDDKEASRLLQRGCALGDPFGCYFFGRALLRGEGVAKDKKRGTEPMTKACAEDAPAELRGARGPITSESRMRMRTLGELGPPLRLPLLPRPTAPPRPLACARVPPRRAPVCRASSCAGSARPLRSSQRHHRPASAPRPLQPSAARPSGPILLGPKRTCFPSSNSDSVVRPIRSRA